VGLGRKTRAGKLTLRDVAGPVSVRLGVDPGYSDPMTNQAPDFSKNYPSGGARIGPAWSTAWSALAGGEWKPATQLMSPGITEKTLKNLLGQARRKGLLEVRYPGPCTPAEYRRVQ